MQPDDFELRTGIEFGEWLRAEVASAVFLEQRGFIPDKVRRVSEQLQRDRPESARFVVEIPWIRAFTAFTAPGRYIYFGRRLLERCPNDEEVAFVIAHEIAHHDLGHLRLFQGVFARHAARLAPGQLMVLFFRHLQKRIYSPEWELEADRRALELCMAAGFDGERCLRLFRVLEMIALDYGDISGVYGLDHESDDELSPEASLLTKARIWIWLRQRGYLPIQDRHAMARRHLETLRNERVISSSTV